MVGLNDQRVGEKPVQDAGKSESIDVMEADSSRRRKERYDVYEALC